MSVPKRDRDVWYLLEVTTTTKCVRGRRDNSGSSWRFVTTEKRTEQNQCSCHWKAVSLEEVTCEAKRLEHSLVLL